MSSFLRCTNILALAVLACVAQVGVTYAAPISSLRAGRALLGSVENGLSKNGTCGDVTFIFARGTGEAGNVGTLTGPPLFSALGDALGTDISLVVQGVDYAADVPGFAVGGDPKGSKTMQSLIEQAASDCADTKIVVGGYSQGAQLVHNAAKNLGADVTSRIAAVAVFGDPDNGQDVGQVSSDLVSSTCHDGDIICTGKGSFATHLTYSEDAKSVAAFIAGKVQ